MQHVLKLCVLLTQSFIRHERNETFCHSGVFVSAKGITASTSATVVVWGRNKETKCDTVVDCWGCTDGQ